MLFSCPVTRFISLACFYDQPFPLHPTHSVAFPHLISSPPISSFLFPSPYIQNPVCTHVCILPNPTQPSPPKPCLALHPPIIFIFFFFPSSSSSRHHVTTGDPAPAPAPPPPAAAVLPKTKRLVLLFKASNVCSVDLPFSFSSRLILTAAAVNPMLKAKMGSKNLRRLPQREKKILGELLLCCVVLGNVLWKMENGKCR